MTVVELERELEKRGVPKDFYSIMAEGLPNEKLCIVKENKWQVYYSERGCKTGLKEFEQETEACEYFCDLAKNYGL